MASQVIQSLDDRSAWSPAWPGPLRDDRTAHLVDEALRDMQAAGRHALRVVAAGCGSGVVLIRTLVRARALGFVAIEGFGFDSDADDILIARWATRSWQDPAIGIAFEAADLRSALAAEEDHGADILLCARGALERLPIEQRAAVTREIRRITGRLILTGETQEKIR